MTHHLISSEFIALFNSGNQNCFHFSYCVHLFVERPHISEVALQASREDLVLLQRLDCTTELVGDSVVVSSQLTELVGDIDVYVSLDT
jgi:hypothetical protein